MGCNSLLQGIFPTQGLNLGLLHCRQILYCLSHRLSQNPATEQHRSVFKTNARTKWGYINKPVSMGCIMSEIKPEPLGNSGSFPWNLLCSASVEGTQENLLVHVPSFLFTFLSSFCYLIHTFFQPIRIPGLNTVNPVVNKINLIYAFIDRRQIKDFSSY